MITFKIELWNIAVDVGFGTNFLQGWVLSWKMGKCKESNCYQIAS